MSEGAAGDSRARSLDLACAAWAVSTAGLVLQRSVQGQEKECPPKICPRPRKRIDLGGSGGGALAIMALENRPKSVLPALMTDVLTLERLQP